MRFEIVKREQRSSWFSLFVLLGSLLAGFVAVGLIFAINRVNPFYALFRILGGSFGSLYGIKETITKAIPLILIGGGLTLVFRAKFWNIGAEGQLLFGAILAGWIGLDSAIICVVGSRPDLNILRMRLILCGVSLRGLLAGIRFCRVLRG